MKTHFLIGLVFIGLFGTVVTSMADNPRPQWDQKKAKSMVEKILATEQSGNQWDKIKWSTDIDEVVTRSRNEDKPIFVYWYVSKGGPQTAPC